MSFRKERESGTETETGKKATWRQREAEIGARLPQAEECLGLPGAGRNRKDSTPEDLEKARPYQPLDLRLMAPRTGRE